MDTTDASARKSIGPNFGRGTMKFPWSYTESFITSPIPIVPVKGVWNVSVKTAQHSRAAQVTNSFVSLDPGFHRLVNGVPVPNEGTILLQLPNAIQTSISINTATLSNGVHKLFIRDDVKVEPFSIPGSDFPPSSPFPGGTNSGILMIAFTVSN